MPNKIALITGGSSGIGSDLCYKAAKKFDKVIFTYFKNKKKANLLYKKLIQINPNIFYFYLDLSSMGSINELLAKLKKKKLSVNILINNAAVSQIKNISLINYKDWNFVMNSNLRGPFFLTQKLIKNMKKKNGEE
jgi:3-oxoacyl-[acyl-carrier protein] reductase